MHRQPVEPTKRKAFSRKQRAEAFLRAEGRCECGCGTKIIGPFEVNHKIPLFQGGLHEPGNWEVLLPEHHRELTKVHAGQNAKIRRILVKNDPDREKPPSRWGKRAFQKSDMKRTFSGRVVPR